MPVIARNPATRNSEANILVYPGSPADSPDRSTLPCAPKFFVLLVVVATHHNSRPFITKGVLKVQRCARRNAKNFVLSDAGCYKINRSVQTPPYPKNANRQSWLSPSGDYNWMAYARM